MIRTAAPRHTGRGPTRRRAGTFLLVALAVAALLAFTLVRLDESGRPYDPRSTRPDGLRAMTTLFEELGAEVTLDRILPADDTNTALLVDDRLGAGERQQLVDWVRRGGTLVVADPTSPLNPLEPAGIVPPGGLAPDPDLERACALRALREVDTVAAPNDLLLNVPEDRAVGCYTTETGPTAQGGSWLAVDRIGAGNLVLTGGPAPFTNQHLTTADNALLATALLAPRSSTRTAVLRPAPPAATGGEQTLGDLIPPPVRAALWQLAVVFLLVALWRGRRLGQPVQEHQPARIPASELVLASGNLLHSAEARTRAAALLAGELQRVLAERLGLPPGSDPEQIAAVAAARTGTDRELVLAALTGEPPRSEADLVERAQTVEAVRQAVTRAR